MDPIGFVCVHTSLGENDAAFEWRQKAYEERTNSELMYLKATVSSTPACARTAGSPPR